MISSSRIGRLSTVKVVFEPFHSRPVTHKYRLRLKIPLVVSIAHPENGFFNRDLFSVASRMTTPALESKETANMIVTVRLFGKRERVRRRGRSRIRANPWKRQRVVEGRSERKCSKCDKYRQKSDTTTEAKAVGTVALVVGVDG